MVGSEQEIAGVSVSLPGSLTLAGVFFGCCARTGTYMSIGGEYKMSSRISPTTAERFSNSQAPKIHVGGNRANHLNILRTPIDDSLPGRYVSRDGAELSSVSMVRQPEV